MKFKLTHVLTHQAPFVKGIRQFTQTLDAKDGVEMFYTAEGVFCKYKNVSFIVPLGNVASVTCAEGVDILPSSEGNKDKK